jgi:GTP-binding protein
MVFDLFSELGATEEQLDFTYVYAIAREGIAKRSLSDDSTTLQPLFDVILSQVPPAPNDTAAPMRMQPCNLGYDDFIGRLAIGRVYEGIIRNGQQITLINSEGVRTKHKISKLLTNKGLKKIEVESAEAGDIVTIAGIPEVFVSDTVAELPDAEAIPTINVDPPTLKMDFMVNNSPFAGREGTFVTSRQIRDRLEKELETNVGLRVDFSDSSDAYTVHGRGEMHLSILIEQMRREGFELQVSQPRVAMREENGKTLEPYETVVVDVPDGMSGTVIEKLGKRKGEMTNMKSENGYTRLEYTVPTRGLLGYRTEFITDTKGEGMLAHQFSHYDEFRGEIEKRSTGSMINGFDGVTTAFSLYNLQERGPLFIGAGVEVYEGMVIGMSMKDNMTVNPIKGKKLTNMRASGSDEAIKLIPPIEMNLERALEYIDSDEYVEITPQSVRIRKKWLKEADRKRHGVA